MARKKIEPEKIEQEPVCLDNKADIVEKLNSIKSFLLALDMRANSYIIEDAINYILEH